MGRMPRKLLLLVCGTAIILIVTHQFFSFKTYCSNNAEELKSHADPLKERACTFDREALARCCGRQLVMAGRPVNRDLPLIFIGGVPRSGTTLMRAMLDAHPAVRCGEETRVIPRILNLRSHWKKSAKESLRLSEAGLSDEVIDSAISSFILEVIVRHGEPSERLCNKDPFTLKSAGYLHQLFPKAKFLFMLRDGRATVHSVISRGITITGFDLTSYRQSLRRWNTVVDAMDRQCEQLGPDWCLRVPYEQLVLHPRRWMRRVLNFLDVPWNETVMHHEKAINKPGGVSLSKVEKSSDQVIRPVNQDALTKWVGQLPDDVVRDMPDLAPMLETLGYDPDANPPDYNKISIWDEEV